MLEPGCRNLMYIIFKQSLTLRRMTVALCYAGVTSWYTTGLLFWCDRVAAQGEPVLFVRASNSGRSRRHHLL